MSNQDLLALKILGALVVVGPMVYFVLRDMHKELFPLVATCRDLIKRPPTTWWSRLYYGLATVFAVGMVGCAYLMMAAGAVVVLMGVYLLVKYFASGGHCDRAVNA